MKIFVRVLCLILACLFCMFALVACKDNNSKKKRKNEVEIKTDENGVRWAKDEWGTWREYDDLPDEELDYDDEPISFLYWTGESTVKAEFVQVEEVDDARLSSIYKRNEAIMDRLGVELVFTAEAGDSGSMNTFVARVKRSYDAGTNDFDLIGAYSRSQGAMLTAGYLVNLTKIENNYISAKGINGRTESKPWWPANIAGNLGIYHAGINNLYYVSGDISTNAIDQMHCIYFNKDLVNKQYEEMASEYFSANAHKMTPEAGEDEGGDTATNMLYEKAYAGKWVLDDFIELCSNTYVDTKSDGVTVDDTFGLCSINYCMTALYGGANLRMIENDVNTTLKISDDWTSNKTVKLIAKLSKLLRTTNYHTDTTTGKTYFQPFNNGKSYFSVYYMRMAEDYLMNNDKVENYGILPVPKYDTAQKNYYTVIGNEFSIYSVFRGRSERGDAAATDSMLTAVLECWASEAFRKTTPVIFELNMKLKSSPTQCEADMCEIIRQSIEFDMGRIFGSQLSGKVDETIQMDSLASSAALTGTSWATVTEANLGRMTTNLATFVAGLDLVKNG
ncbi:MAG: hypothetical protein E7650_04845 [Ruminococcaceae bacterium]|nr:hypothetical protein [Oscillospiraceae bacterium]